MRRTVHGQTQDATVNTTLPAVKACLTSHYLQMAPTGSSCSWVKSHGRLSECKNTVGLPEKSLIPGASISVSKDRTRRIQPKVSRFSHLMSEPYNISSRHRMHGSPMNNLARSPPVWFHHPFMRNTGNLVFERLKLQRRGRKDVTKSPTSEQGYHSLPTTA